MSFNRGFHYEPSILWYPYFWKHPFVGVISYKLYGRINLELSWIMVPWQKKHEGAENSTKKRSVPKSEINLGFWNRCSWTARFKGWCTGKVQIET